MDPYQAFLRKAQETSDEMKSRYQTKTYKSDKGATVEGWAFHTKWDSCDDEQRFSSAIGDFEQSWGTGFIVLTTTGEFYDYYESHHEYGSGRPGGERIEHSYTLYRTAARSIVSLGRGKPFAKATEMLERLVWDYSGR